MRRAIVITAALLIIALVLGGVAAQSPFEIRVFIDNENLTVYIPSGGLVSLRGFGFQVQVSGQTRLYVLEEYAAFGIPFDQLPTPVCFRLRNSGTRIPLAQACNGVTTLTQELAPVDVFWFDGAAGVSRAMLLVQGGVPFGICASGTNECLATFTPPRYTAPPTWTVTSTPEFTATPTLMATPEPTSAASEVDGQLLTTTGMVVSLTWSTITDLDLEVRDPMGESLYYITPTGSSGGRLGSNVNQGCVNTTPNAVESATWPPGGVLTGSYEVIVYYQDACEGDMPVSFSVAVTVDGRSLGEVSGTLNPGQAFVTSFVVISDGSSRFTNLSGVVEEQVLPDIESNILLSAIPLPIGASVDGTITTQNPYDAYSFNAQANELVTVSMNATSGSLDTFLLLLDPTGSIVQFSDDVGVGITDSQISGALLTVSGTYTIVATRYAKRVGGTEGDYTLRLGRVTSNLPHVVPEFTNVRNTVRNLLI